MATETHIQCSESRSDNQIRIAPSRKLNCRVIAITNWELVAAEGHYHRSWYCAYIREEPAGIIAASKQGDYIDSQYKSAEKHSHGELLLYISNELIQKPQILNMTDLTSMLVFSINSLGIKEVSYSTKKHLLQSWKQNFQISSTLSTITKEISSFTPDSLSICELAKTTTSLKEEQEYTRSVNTGDVVKKTHC